MVDEYRKRHASVWPDMQNALRRAGWCNYSLFLTEDGLAVGYVETENFEASLAAMNELNINTQWQVSMAPLVAVRDGRRVDESLLVLDEIFHLD